MRSVVAFVTLMLVGLGVQAEDVLLFGGENNKQFLGCVNCSEYDAASINNEFGRYGSRYSATSIWNEYGVYGSRYSQSSPMNPYASNPPVVVDRSGRFYGYLTNNPALGRTVQIPDFTEVPARSYSAADHLTQLQRLAGVAAQMYPNGVPESAGPADFLSYQALPEPEPREPPLLIDGRNFDPMVLQGNQIAYEQEHGARDECERRWSESVSSIPDSVSFSRRERIVALYSQDRARCIAEARAAQ